MLGPAAAFYTYSCAPAGVHGPARIVWADLTPSPRCQALRKAAILKSLYYTVAMTVPTIIVTVTLGLPWGVGTCHHWPT